jgi:hypothetical protein
MKIVFLTILAACFCLNLNAQDLIVKKNGDEIKSKVIKVGSDEIEYKKFENLDGPSYTIPKSDVFMIRYQNGTKDVINPMDESPKEKKKEKVKSESSSSSSGNINEGGNNIIAMDVGFLTGYLIDYSTYKWTGTGIGISYLHSVSKNINIGVEIHFLDLTSQSFTGYDYDYNFNLLPYSYKVEISVISFMAKSQFFWLNHPRFGLYSGFDFGYATASGKRTYDYGYNYYGTNDAVGTGTSGQLIFIGGKLRGKSESGWFANYELGYGMRGVINIGFGYQF